MSWKYTGERGAINPQYTHTFVFTNDFSALLEDVPSGKPNSNTLLSMKTERGICRVVNFTPRHDLTLAEMQESEIEEVIAAWQNEFSSIGSHPRINYVQIFENKGSLMGNSNPHPHGQIWAQESIPTDPLKELKHFRWYFTKKRRSLLADYLTLELRLKERVVYENTRL